MDMDFAKILNKRAEADAKEREARQKEDSISLSQFIENRDAIMNEEKKENRAENLKAQQAEEEKRLDKARRYISSINTNVQQAVQAKKTLEPSGHLDLTAKTFNATEYGKAVQEAAEKALDKKK